MTAAAVQDKPVAASPALPAKVEAAIAGFVALAIAALQFPLVWSRAINWDEFFHYSQITRFRNGTLTAPLQTFYVRAFNWIWDLPGNSVDHIVAARFVMFGFELLTALAIAGIAARFFDRTTAVLCAAAYLGAGFVFQHGTSFRADPVIAGLLMSSLWLILATGLRPWAIALAGALLGTAALYSIKVILYAPAFAGIAWLAWNEAGRSRAFALRLVVMGVVALAVLGALYWWHSSTLHGQVGQAAGRTMSSSAENMFFLGLPPYWRFMVKQVAIAPVFAFMLVIAIGLLVRTQRPAAERLALAGLIAPLAVLGFYHNTSAYFYVFLLAPVSVGVGLGIAFLKDRVGIIAPAAALLINTGMLWVREDSAPIREQRMLVDTANRIFPQGVAYFDFCGFLGRFEKVNGFMTPWGLVGYRNGQGPSYRDRMEAQAVPLVVNDDPMWEQLLSGQPTPIFRPEDVAALRGNYVQFWGPYWVAGKDVTSTAPVRSEFLVPGTYTVTGAPIVIDGVRYAVGATLEIARGFHTVAAEAKPARLVWGNHLKAPEQPWSGAPFWTLF